MSGDDGAGVVGFAEALAGAITMHEDSSKGRAAMAREEITTQGDGGACGTWRLKRTSQCAHCPWIKGVDPHSIPNGYSEDRHRDLRSTIANPSDPLSTLAGQQVVMACHELEDAHCVGWVANQVGRGNNIGLRLRLMRCENAGQIRLRGAQHQRFEDTLP